jgi:hypothetical protein
MVAASGILAIITSSCNLSNCSFSPYNTLPFNASVSGQQYHGAETPNTVHFSVARHVTQQTSQGNGTKLGVRNEHVVGPGNSRKGRINLNQVERHGQPGWKDLFESKRVQENGEADGTEVEQEHSVQELPVFFRHNTEKDHEIHVESKKVLGPEVKELDHARGALVKLFVGVAPSFARRTSVLEACNGKPSANHNKRPKDIDALQNTTTYVRPKRLAGLLVVIYRSKHTQEGKEYILVNKASRQDSLVRIVSSILRIGQDLERKVRRRALKNA